MKRSFKTAFPDDFLRDYQAGVMRYRYRGRRCLRSPIDMAIQARALWDLRPETVIEIGTHSGGGTLWLADTVQAYELDARVYSVDLEPPKDLYDDRIVFARGDVTDLGAVFAALDLMNAPHPWFVLEDSAHTRDGCRAALEFLSRHMAAGDLLVMEDGVLVELGFGERYHGGPNRAIEEFLEENPGIFSVDTALCDMFGPNATYAPNGYLRKS
jgi:cephalosporin hydroxylase